MQPVNYVFKGLMSPMQRRRPRTRAYTRQNHVARMYSTHCNCNHDDDDVMMIMMIIIITRLPPNRGMESRSSSLQVSVSKKSSSVSASSRTENRIGLGLGPQL